MLAAFILGCLGLLISFVAVMFGLAAMFALEVLRDDEEGEDDDDRGA